MIDEENNDNYFYVGQELCCRYVPTQMLASLTKGKVYTVTDISDRDRRDVPVGAVWLVTDNWSRPKWFGQRLAKDLFVPVKSLPEEIQFSYKLSGEIPQYYVRLCL